MSGAESTEAAMGDYYSYEDDKEEAGINTYMQEVHSRQFEAEKSLGTVDLLGATLHPYYLTFARVSDQPGVLEPNDDLNAAFEKHILKDWGGTMNEHAAVHRGSAENCLYRNLCLEPPKLVPRSWAILVALNIMMASENLFDMIAGYPRASNEFTEYTTVDRPKQIGSHYGFYLNMAYLPLLLLGWGLWRSNTHLCLHLPPLNDWRMQLGTVLFHGAYTLLNIIWRQLLVATQSQPNYASIMQTHGMMYQAIFDPNST